jgi:hypothetical protein
MHDAVEEYLDEVLAYASLARGDERRVREELRDHLEELAATTRENRATEEEVCAMLHNDFGKPEAIGSAIAKAKGRFRTYLKKQRRRLPITLAVTVIVVVLLELTLVRVFRAATDAVAPDIPRGSRMLVYKLASTFRPGDVVAFRSAEGLTKLGIVQSVNDKDSSLTVMRNKEPEEIVERGKVIGRVVANTR